MAVKDLRILYQAKNNTTGLTDVKAQVYLNGSPKAVGVSAIALTELDSTNSPGLYELLIPAATLVSWGVVAGQYNAIEGYIDSVSKPAKAPFREELTAFNSDDINSKLGTPAGASVSADIAAIKSDTGAIKTDLETGAYSLQNILEAVQAIQNNAGFAIPVPSQLVIPSTGSNLYKIPVTIYDDINNLIDPDAQTITVSLKNQAGVSRDSYLSSTTMTRDSLGQYSVDVTMAAGSPEEELVFTFSYSIGGNATARKAVSIAMLDVAAEGLALQSTLLNVQTTVNGIDTKVDTALTGIATIDTKVDSIQTDLTSGLGSGFVSGTDSLHAISTYLVANMFTGGRAV